MKICYLAATSLFALTAFARAGERHIAYEKGNEAVYIANLDGTGEKKLADGIFPAISPDGTRVAFNTVEKNGTTYVRHIAVVDIATGKVNVFKDVPSDNAYYPTWSPDGKWIAFTLRRDEVWDLGLIKEDGTGFNVIKKGVQNETTLYSPCWGHDQQTVFCQDMTNIYQLSLDGKIRAQWKVESIVPNGSMSGDCRIDVSPDGSKLLLSIEMGEEHHRKDWDGPQPALWSFDLATKKAVRITGKNVFAWDGCWLDSVNVLFLNQPVGEKEASIYTMSIDGKNPKRLIKNARMPSVSQP